MEYKKVILHALQKEHANKKAVKSSLAKAMGCQLSYLSQVLNRTTIINLEQAIGVVSFLPLMSYRQNIFYF